MNKITDTGPQGLVDSGAKAGLKAALAPVLNPTDYASDMAAFDMTEDQEREFLETLWSIMGHFARLGFSVDVCGLIFEEFNEASAPAAGDGNLVPSTNMESASESKGGSA